MNEERYTFSRRPLLAPGHERMISGQVYRGRRCLELSLVRDGERRGTFQIQADGAPVIAYALELARTSMANQKCGTVADGRFQVNVSTGDSRSRSGVPILLQKVDSEGINAGPTVALFFGEDLEGLEAGLMWLLEAHQ